MRREILRPDQTFFFATTFELEQGQRSSWQPCKRCRSSTRAQENKDIWDLSNIGLDEKIQLFGRRENKSRKGKIEAGHRTSLLHKHFFLRIFIQMFLLVYLTIKIRDAQRLPLHLQPRKDQLKSFQYCLWRLQSQLVILPCKIAGRKKKIRLWSTLLSSTSKMIHVIEKKILPPFEERSTKRKLLV